MKLISITCALLFAFVGLQAQDINLLSYGQFGGPDAHVGLDLAIDNEGNIITCGYFAGFADFNPGSGSQILTSAGGRDGYIAKLNASGQLQWVYRFGNTGDDYIYKVAIDPYNNVVCTGSHRGSIDADPGASELLLGGIDNSDHGMILKFDANGALLWGKNFALTEGGGACIMNAVDIDGNGNIAVGGNLTFYSGSIDLNPGDGTQTVDATTRIMYVRLNEDGNFISAVAMTGYSFYDVAVNAIEQDNFGNIYLAGHYASIIDFDPGPGSYEINGNGPMDAFLCKLNAQGGFVSLQYWPDPEGSIRIYDMKIGSDGKFYIVGNFNSTSDFDPDLLSQVIIDNSANNDLAYLMVLNNDGSLDYAHLLTTSAPSAATGISLNDDGQILVHGQYNGTTDLNPDSNDTFMVTSTAGTTDLFVSKLDADGNFITGFSLGGGGQEESRDIIAVPNSQKFWITGGFSVNMDADPSSGTVTMTSGGSTDAYLLCYNECTPQYSEFDAVGCGSYEWNNQFYAFAGDYTQTLITQTGCDSIVTLHLTMANNTSFNLTASACDSYLAPNGSTYSESGDYTLSIPNSAGCDSIIYLNLTIYNTPAGEYTIDGNTITCITPSESYQWYACTENGFVEIAGATSSTFNPTQSGSYGVEFTSGPCSNTQCIEFVYDGIEEATNIVFSIYPNPTEDVATIAWQQQQQIQIQLTDMTGRVTHMSQSTSNQYSLDTSHLANGLYEVTLTTLDGKRSTKRLLIN